MTYTRTRAAARRLRDPARLRPRHPGPRGARGHRPVGPPGRRHRRLLRHRPGDDPRARRGRGAGRGPGATSGRGPRGAGRARGGRGRRARPGRPGLSVAAFARASCRPRPPRPPDRQRRDHGLPGDPRRPGLGGPARHQPPRALRADRRLWPALAEAGRTGARGSWPCPRPGTTAAGSGGRTRCGPRSTTSGRATARRRRPTPSSPSTSTGSAPTLGVRAFSVHPGGILTPLQRHLRARRWSRWGGSTRTARRSARGSRTPSRRRDHRLGGHLARPRRPRRRLLRGLRRRGRLRGPAPRRRRRLGHRPRAGGAPVDPVRGADRGLPRQQRLTPDHPQEQPVHAVVQRTSRPVPQLVRVVLGGGDLDSFEMPRRPTPTSTSRSGPRGRRTPSSSTPPRSAESEPEETWPARRRYTVRRWDPRPGS